MNVTQLALIKTESHALPYGIAAKLEDGREIYIIGGFQTQKHAVLNIGAALAKYKTLYMYDNEYPVNQQKPPTGYSLLGDTALYEGESVFYHREHWINPEFTVIKWFNAKNIFVG